MSKQFEGQPIVDIQFTPVQPLDPADLDKAQPLKKGQPLRADDVARAIDGLFATGRFEDIAVEAEPSGAGVVVRFVVKPAWFVGGVVITGNVVVPPNRGQIVSVAPLNLGAPFHEADLQEAVNRIKQLMKANGLYEAQVTPHVERDNTNQLVSITFEVKEGKRAKYEAPVITGNPRLSENTIIRATGWRVPLIHWWRQVTDSRTRKGVRGVLGKYQKQDRLTAQVMLEKLDYDAQRRRVRATLNVNPGPKVQIKTLETKVSRRTLKKYVPVYQFRSVDNSLLTQGEKNLRDYFQSKGYFDVDIDYRVLPPANDVETVEYVIARGPRLKLVRVQITGNKYFTAEDLRERMFMEPAHFLRLRHGHYSQVFQRKDEENIGNLYRANGFHDVRVSTTVERNYRGKSGDLAATVKIVEGDQWFVDNLTVSGIEKVKREEIVSRLASNAGQPFAEANIANDRNALLTAYYEQGFPEAAFSASWQPSGLPHHVNVFYTVKEGEQKFVRNVLISGLHTTRRSLVDKHILLKPGERLSPLQETEAQRQFYDMGIFARVDTAVQNPDGDTDHKNVLYSFKEAHRYNLAFGFGAQVGRFGTPNPTSLTAPVGSTGFAPLFSLDVSRLNMFGVGHRATVRGSYSSLQKLASFNYYAPRFHNVEGRDITFTALYEQALDVRTFSSKRQEASIQLSQKLSKPTTVFFRLTYRRDSVGNVVIPVLLIPPLLQPQRLGMFGFNLVQDRRDNPADPHRGMYNSGSLEVAGAFLGSQRSFTRVLLRNATYHRQTRRVVLARQTQIGVISPYAAHPGLTATQSVPLPERFFAGGADSLRAFPFNQAGPRDIGAPLVPGGPSSVPTGFPLGGNALFINNVELRFPFIGENVQGVLFHDMGNVFTTLRDISFRFSQRNLQDFNYTVHAVGFGIRYRTPIGPVRLDLAYSINPPSFIGFSGSTSQVLQCNPNVPPSQLPAFCTPSKQSVGHFQFFFSIGQAF